MKILISGNWSPLKLVCELLSEPEGLLAGVSRARVTVVLHVVTAPASPIIVTNEGRKNNVMLRIDKSLSILMILTKKELDI